MGPVDRICAKHLKLLLPFKEAKLRNNYMKKKKKILLPRYIGRISHCRASFARERFLRYAFVEKKMDYEVNGDVQAPLEFVSI